MSMVDELYLEINIFFVLHVFHSFSLASPVMFVLLSLDLVIILGNEWMMRGASRAY